MALLHCNFFSEVLGMASAMDVLLPEPATSPSSGPDHKEQRSYPVLYLLHGHSDDHTIWQRRTSIERYVAGRRLAVIMPNAHRSYYTDMTHGLNYWTFISEELPYVVEHLFPISARREDTYAAGLSMGGYGAFKLALSQPDRFAAAASMSGALDVAALQEDPQLASSETLSLAFGESGTVRGSTNDLFALAGDLVTSGASNPALYQCCGTEDFLFKDNIRFREHARKLGLPLTYEEGPGDHEWGYWDQQIQRVLDWLPGAAASTVEGDGNGTNN